MLVVEQPNSFEPIIAESSKAGLFKFVLHSCDVHFCPSIVHFCSLRSGQHLSERHVPSTIKSDFFQANGSRSYFIQYLGDTSDFSLTSNSHGGLWDWAYGSHGMWWGVSVEEFAVESSIFPA